MPESSLVARAAAWGDADPDPRTRSELAQLLANGDTATDLLTCDRGPADLAGGRAGRSPGQPFGPAQRHPARTEDPRRGRPHRPVMTGIRTADQALAMMIGAGAARTCASRTGPC